MTVSIMSHVTDYLLPQKCIHSIPKILSRCPFQSTVRFPVMSSYKIQGAVSIRKTVLPGMAIPMLKIRRPNGRLIFNMEIAIRR